MPAKAPLFVALASTAEFSACHQLIRPGGGAVHGGAVFTVKVAVALLVACVRDCWGVVGAYGFVFSVDW